MVNYLTKEKTNSEEAFKEIILTNHPIFRRLANITDTRYRVFFTNVGEMDAWLSSRGWAEDLFHIGDYISYDYDNKRTGAKYNLKISKKLFNEDDTLIGYSESEWEDGMVQFTELAVPDDDLPF